MTSLLIKNIPAHKVASLEALLAQQHLEFELVSEAQLKRQAMRHDFERIAALAPPQDNSLAVLREDRAR